MVPNIGTLLMLAGLLWATNAGALPLRTPAAAGTSTGTIAYQGRLADSAGDPITDTVNMEFRLYDVTAGGAPLWSELWTGANAVRVSDGLFNVMLGSLTQIDQADIAGHDQLWLGITVGTDDEMTPRVQLGSVPFAVQALTVPGMETTTIVRPDWGGSGTNATCVDLVHELRNRGFSQCTYVTSGEGEGAWFRTEDCSGNVYKEPSVWQKHSLYTLIERPSTHATRIKITGCCIDQAPYLICTKTQ